MVALYVPQWFRRISNLLDAQPHLLGVVISKLHWRHTDYAVGKAILEHSVWSIERVTQYRDRAGNHIRAMDGEGAMEEVNFNSVRRKQKAKK